MPAVHLARPLSAVRILNGYMPKDRTGMLEASGQPAPAAQTGVEQAALTKELESQKRLYHDTCRAFQEAVDRMSELYDKVFAGHHEAIARLSVEIARKVLMRNIREGDYEIEAIIQEALKNAPESNSTVVRLNPQDLDDIRTLQEEGTVAFSGAELVPDSAVGRAECVVESPQGVLKLLIDEHLEQISKALTATG